MNFNFEWPQITYLGLNFISMLILANRHGKPKEGKENFFIPVISWLPMLWVLYEGGFFTK